MEAATATVTGFGETRTFDIERFGTHAPWRSCEKIASAMLPSGTKIHTIRARVTKKYDGTWRLEKGYLHILNRNTGRMVGWATPAAPAPRENAKADKVERENALGKLTQASDALAEAAISIPTADADLAKDAADALYLLASLEKALQERLGA